MVSVGTALRAAPRTDPDVRHYRTRPPEGRVTGTERAITQEYFKGIKAFRSVFPDNPGPAALVFAGEDVQERSSALVNPVRQVQELLSAIDRAAGE